MREERIAYTILLFVAIVAAAVCYGIWCLGGVTGCFIVGGMIIAVVAVRLVLKRRSFYRNAPDWFEEAMASTKWSVEIDRLPAVLLRERRIEIVKVIPRCTLKNASGRHIWLTRRWVGERTNIWGGFVGITYGNEMYINRIQVSSSDQGYVDKVMSRICRTEGIK